MKTFKFRHDEALSNLTPAPGLASKLAGPDGSSDGHKDFGEMKRPCDSSATDAAHPPTLSSASPQFESEERPTLGDADADPPADILALLDEDGAVLDEEFIAKHVGADALPGALGKVSAAAPPSVPPSTKTEAFETVSRSNQPDVRKDASTNAGRVASVDAKKDLSTSVGPGASVDAKTDRLLAMGPGADRGPQDAPVSRIMGSRSPGLPSTPSESQGGGRPARRSLPPTDLELNLLIQWEPAWRGFLASIPPAFLLHTKPLAVECRSRRFDPFSTAVSVVAHVAILLVLIGGYQAHQASEVLLQAGGHRSYDVIYFSGPYLPPLEDRGGALIGVSGKSGGRELQHVQPIRVARGTKVAASTVDAPDLKLPHTDKAVANLLSVHPVAPSAPVQALHSMLAKLGFAPDVAPPAPPVDVAQRPAPQLATEVVPPAPETTSLNQKTAQMKIDAVPAPVSAPARDTSAMARLRLPAEAVAPPPSGISRASALPHGMGGSPQVAPPPPELAGVKAGSPDGTPNGVGSADVAPPPPSASQIADGALDSALNAISNAVRAAGIGSANGPGVIASAHPGKDVAIPNGAGAGEIALSPTGGNSLGRGGSGGGTGIGHGPGPGNAPSGNGPGSGIADIGPGAASGRGNSPYPGDGGAGSSPVAASSSGVWVASRGPVGSVSIPSFSTSGNAPSPGHSPSDPRRRKPAVTVVGTSRSGGALNQYGVLPGSRVYTVYIDTDAGTAVLQYSAADTSGKEFSQDLVAPEAVRAEVPADLRSTKFVVACVVDRSGLLRNLHVLQNSAPGTLGQLIAMLQDWRFRPVLRGNAAIEVNAIVGFNIDTR